MLSPEKSQVEICLLKSNLEEIEHELIAQRSSWPKIDAENELKFRESLNAVKVSRALSVEIEQLNQENVRLAAKRMNLKMRSEELAKALEKVRGEYSDMTKETNDEKQEIELLTRKYEDLLREKTAKFRESRACFDKTEMEHAIKKEKKCTGELENELQDRRAVMEALKNQLDGLTASVPEDLLVIVGKSELLNKAKSLSEKSVALQDKRNNIWKKVNNASSPSLKK